MERYIQIVVLGWFAEGTFSLVVGLILNQRLGNGNSFIEISIISMIAGLVILMLRNPISKKIKAAKRGATN